MGPAYRRDHRRRVERADGAQIEHLGLDPVRRQHLGRSERLADHARERDDGDVLAGAQNGGLADGYDMIDVIRDFEALAVEQLVLQKNDGIGIADRDPEQPLRVGRRIGRDHLETRHMAVPTRITLGMLSRDPGGWPVGPRNTMGQALQPPDM